MGYVNTPRTASRSTTRGQNTDDSHRRHHHYTTPTPSYGQYNNNNNNSNNSINYGNATSRQRSLPRAASPLQTASSHSPLRKPLSHNINIKISKVDAEHERSILARQELHNRLMKAVMGRRERAISITELHKTEAASVEGLLVCLDKETTELDGLKRELCDKHRLLEVELFKANKQLDKYRFLQGVNRGDANDGRSSYSILNTNTNNNDNVGTSGWLKLSPSYASSIVTRHFQPQSTLQSFVTNSKEKERDELRERIKDAIRISTELENTCRDHLTSIIARKEERGALTDMQRVCLEEINILEEDSIEVAAATSKAKMLLRTAGEHQLQLPELQRLADNNTMNIHLLKEDYNAVTSMLMARIKDDDNKIAVISKAIDGADGSVLATMARDISNENDAIEHAVGMCVDAAEKQRLLLDETTATLKERIEYLESKIRCGRGTLAGLRGGEIEGYSSPAAARAADAD